MSASDEVVYAATIHAVEGAADQRLRLTLDDLFVASDADRGWFVVGRDVLVVFRERTS